MADWCVSENYVTTQIDKIMWTISKRFRLEFRQVAMDTRNTEIPFILKQKMTKYFCAKRLSLATGKVPGPPCARKVPEDLIWSDLTPKRNPDNDFILGCYEAILLRNETYKFSGKAISVLTRYLWTGDSEALINDDDLPADLNVTYIMFAYFNLNLIKGNIENKVENRKALITTCLRSLLEILVDSAQRRKDEFSRTLLRITKRVYRLLFQIDSVFESLKEYCRLFDSKKKDSRRTSEKPEDIDNVGPIDEEVFRLLVEGELPVRIELSLNWPSFDKWSLSYLLREEGYVDVSYSDTDDEPVMSFFFNYIVHLKKSVGNLPVLLEESFCQHPSLYDDCIPRPFPDLQSFWIHASESIFIMAPDQFYNIDYTGQHSLLVQIFGTSYVETFDSEVTKGTTLEPREALFIPCNLIYTIIAESACGLKKYQWNQQGSNSGNSRLWMVRTDCRHAELLKKKKVKALKASRSKPKEENAEQPKQESSDLTRTKQTMKTEESSDLIDASDCVKSSEVLKTCTKSKHRKKILKCTKMHLVLGNILNALRKCRSSRLEQYAQWLKTRERNISKRERAIAKRECLLDEKEKEVEKCIKNPSN